MLEKRHAGEETCWRLALESMALSLHTLLTPVTSYVTHPCILEPDVWRRLAWAVEASRKHRHHKEVDDERGLRRGNIAEASFAPGMLNAQEGHQMQATTLGAHFVHTTTHTCIRIQSSSAQVVSPARQGWVLRW